MAKYDKAVELNPRDSSVYFKSGNEKIETQDYKGAIEDYTKVIQLKPNNADANVYLNR
ncbi:MAG: tetratricopeptide repeat protein [Candidatus Gastranaerophilales bacterium]|nr:tetratricopeptide repeat protein [Candidatus Gastranaerophilales bacterium]